ncbi:PREDICTED: F-box/FBD/LRR-repeat protein At3g14710 [Tarenaya hassleriana]|uniref:F-box/FBD/LRR-repeat protein At3g14710 n=1 Tax=Tarenaya hassleriana TaxID=28532 RepID=UPI00053C8A1D|nr:PREDICTED: F-box/FBD/LRR-repeat protein At3g14710 [Tarenaya hassleriana]XP_010542330.1 PREDICTED: F-box/FBD/LRR-repeat protein At3g14710 [Tarenaya hassleriana]XP_010542331.1 PREDICTED: F-box/FBD/LRR-repeat protein At3g14710 [Tarenaya hassleriana]
MAVLSSMKSHQSSEIPEDRLSSLHDSVLCRILNRLPIEEAVRTCVLARRWRKTWTNITDLQFDDKKQRDHGDNRFVQLVQHVLHGVSSPHINSFCLESVNTCEESVLGPWLSTVLSRCLQRLAITWYEPESLDLSPFFGRFSSLVELRLRVNSILNIYGPVKLPNLRFFSLEDARIFNVSSASGQLCFCLPALETFEASYCHCFGTSSIVIDSPCLELFEMIECSFEQIPDGSGNCHIRVLAPNLAKIMFSGSLPQTVFLSFPLSLPDAYLSLGKWCWTPSFLEGFSCVKSLGLELSNDFGTAKVPKFRQLVYLHLIYDMVEHRNLMKFLDRSPKLEMLSIRDLESVNPIYHSSLFSIEPPDCVRTTIRVLQIRNFNASLQQLTVVKYFMEKAEILGPVILCTPKYTHVPEEIKARILNYPKASANVRVFFE